MSPSEHAISDGRMTVLRRWQAATFFDRWMGDFARLLLERDPAAKLRGARATAIIVDDSAPDMSALADRAPVATFEFPAGVRVDAAKFDADLECVAMFDARDLLRRIADANRDTKPDVAAKADAAAIVIDDLLREARLAR